MIAAKMRKTRKNSPTSAPFAPLRGHGCVFYLGVSSVSCALVLEAG
jgi:hypothetical protein